MAKKCTVCGKRAYSEYCMAHQPRKPLKRTPLPSPTKRIKQQSKKEQDYQAWKETVARPYLIARDGNGCTCCKRPAFSNEKLDIEHTLGKGSNPALKRDLSNMTLMCRYPCHRNKTDHVPCHGNSNKSPKVSVAL